MRRKKKTIECIEYKMNRLVLVNLDILDEYLETFHIEDEEFYK